MSKIKKLSKKLISLNRYVDILHKKGSAAYSKAQDMTALAIKTEYELAQEKLKIDRNKIKVGQWYCESTKFAKVLEINEDGVRACVIDESYIIPHLYSITIPSYKFISTYSRCSSRKEAFIQAIGEAL